MAALDIGKRETVVEATAQALIRHISSNGLQCGDRLPSERELVDMVGVSRLPLREALCMLKALGVVEAHQGKGVFVKRLDMASSFGMLSPLLKKQSEIELRHVVQVRLFLEPDIAELAASHRTDENLAALGVQLDGMRKTVRVRRAFIEHDMGFHMALARSTGNPVFPVVMGSITALLGEVQYRFPDRPEFRQKSLAYHERILRSVHGRKGQQARRAMWEHMRDVERRI